jgi:NTE family protein
MRAKTIAIACQGGGTHAAFTCGVLTKILEMQRAWAAENRTERFEVMGLSGTSAGALCALMVWYGLAPKAGRDGSVEEAIERLNFLWDCFAAITPVELSHNAYAVALLKAKEHGIPLPGTNPYGPVDDMYLAALRVLGARLEFCYFPPLLQECCPDYDSIEWDKVKLRCLAGAIEVRSGNHEVFDTELNATESGRAADRGLPFSGSGWQLRRPFSLEGVMASGTLPHVLEAESVANVAFPYEDKPRDAVYWDGLYSQNPPVHPFLTEPGRHGKPDEIWVIRINPQERESEPRRTEDIKDRENELAGSVSLNQELDFIQIVNRWAEKYKGTPFAEDHKPITVRTIKMREETARALSSSSKFDRFRWHIDTLRREGSEEAATWLEQWPGVGRYPDDASYQR